MTLKRRYLVLIIGLLVMLSGVTLAVNTQTNFGSVIVTEVNFQSTDGSTIHSTLQKPVYATTTDPLPGVAVIHGSLQSKEWLMAFGIELARRGFVVLTIDANGHGNSDPGSGAGIAAVEYLSALDFVDSSSIGIIGHSMGGSYAWSAVNYSNVAIKSLVLVGARVELNTSYTPDTLLAIGDFDSLFTRYTTNLTTLEPFFNVTDIEIGVTYGSFSKGTARRLVIARTNHLFETIHPLIVQESIEWMKDSLKGGVEDTHWIPSSQLTYPLWLVGGLVGLLGILLTIFPLFVILLDSSYFMVIKKEKSEETPSISTKSFLEYSLLFGFLGVILFYPMLIVGGLLDSVIHFPPSYGLPIITWILGGGLVTALTLSYILKRRNKVELKELIDLDKDQSTFLNGFLRAFLMGGIVTVWLYFWTIIVDWGFVLDLRCFLPGFNDLTILQALSLPIFFIAFLVYFVQEGAWHSSILKRLPEGEFYRSQISWTLKALFAKCFPYIILIAFEYGGGYLTGRALVPGMIGYSFLFFYAFLPWFAVTTVITVWGYRLTNNVYPAAMVNALMCAWLIASILAI